jgi:outer membrane protein OmpA-like peptidoglycan-associated protein
MLNSLQYIRNVQLLLTILCISLLLISCGGRNSSTSDSTNLVDSLSAINLDSSTTVSIKGKLDGKRQRVKLGHAINTVADEYLPILNEDGTKLYFSAMDRTGFFDFKLDYTKQKSAGGEDIYYSDITEGVWADARPLSDINTNGHEVVSQVFKNGDLLVTANYPEKLGVKENKDAGVQTTDLFFLKKTKSSFQINHLPEPVNSIFTEADGWMDSDESYLLFVSDRNGNIGEYHKKGWKWNESFWGNTDVYVSIKDGDYWTVPTNLGSIVNSPGAERTPWLSDDGLTMYVSSNGYEKGKTDLDVYAFKRKNLNDWTDWEGPFSIADANTPYDDWGYKETENGDAYLATSTPLGYKPTQGGTAGDGGIRETNYRPGYQIYGLQTAALGAEFETNIYLLKSLNNPAFTINDVFFDFDSFVIKKSFEKYMELIIDQINQNKQAIIEIHAHTDNVGKASYNQELSLKRADAIKKFIINNGVKSKVVIKGFGDTKPIAPNTSDENRSKNRRVEIYLKDSDGKK